jgi:hypothetical protein
LIDVIIPVFTKNIPYDDLSLCIESVLKNTQDFNLMLCASEKSQPININKGLKRAKSKYIAILDWDVIVSENWLEKITEVLDKNKEVGIIGAKMSGKYESWGGQNSKVPFGMIREWPTLAGGCIVFRNLGLKWDEKFPSGYWADTDFVRQFKEKGYKVFIHGGVVIEHNIIGSQRGDNKFQDIGEKIYEAKWGNKNY